MKTEKKIIKYIDEHKQASASELSDYLNITPRAVFKQLAKLIENRELEKIGTPPKVYYRIAQTYKESEKEQEQVNVPEKLRSYIDKNFIYISPLGEYNEGLNGFVFWCRERNLDIESQADQFVRFNKKIKKSHKFGLINATKKFRSTFDELYLKSVYYVDFYSIPQFGKTKLGQLLLYAKQSQDKARIRQISELIRPKVEKLIQTLNIDALGYIPPTVKREIQFMRELEKNLKLPRTTLKIVKTKTEIIVPQKTLSKMSDRVLNARNTIFVDEKRKFDSVLLIDDAAGSGATLNETAKKIIESDLAENVYGLCITGSYKGYDVISEV